MGTKVPFYPPSPCFGWGGGFPLQAGTRDKAPYRERLAEILWCGIVVWIITA